MRFVSDHNVAATVRGMLTEAGHDCWSAAQAGLHDVADDELAVYATDRKAALLSHDVDFARRRQRNTAGQHVWLRCPEPDAAPVLAGHLPDLLGVLEGMPDVVVELRPDSMTPSSTTWVLKLSPMTAGLAIQATKRLDALGIAPWPGLGLMAAYAAAAIGAGTVLFLLRDA